MSRRDDSFVVAAPPDRVRALCDGATTHLKTVSDWQSSGGALRKSVKQGWGLITNPATIEIEITPAGAGSEVALRASSIGFGPIQDGNLRKALEDLRTAIERMVPAAAAAPVETPRREERPREEPRQPAAQAETVHQLFVSYRREDSGDVTGRICDVLEREFGANALFRDVDSVPLGVDFREHLNAALQSCRVVLAVIGQNWVGTGEQGAARRIDDPTDFVRLEIEWAIQRRIPIIPLLVNRATIPRPEQLPGEISALAYRNGMPIRHDPDFRTDVARLCTELRRMK